MLDGLSVTDEHSVRAGLVWVGHSCPTSCRRSGKGPSSQRDRRLVCLQAKVKSLGQECPSDTTMWDNELIPESFPAWRHQITVDRNPFFFQHYGLTENDLERYLGAALSAGGDYADLYFEYLSSTALTVDESMVKSASQGISAGCGIRVISGERTGYAYTDDLSPARILHAARTAALIASGPAKTPSAGFQQKAARSLYPVTLPSVDAEITAKVELVMRADKAARAYDPRIKEVRANYADELRTILIVGSDGTFAEDSQPLARVNVSCIARNATNSARGSAGGGRHVAIDFFFGDKTPELLPKEAERQDNDHLDARKAQDDDMEVV